MGLRFEEALRNGSLACRPQGTSVSCRGESTCSPISGNCTVRGVVVLSCVLSIVIAVALEGRKDGAGPRCMAVRWRGKLTEENFSVVQSGAVMQADDILSWDLGNEDDTFMVCWGEQQGWWHPEEGCGCRQPWKPNTIGTRSYRQRGSVHASGMLEVECKDRWFPSCMRLDAGGVTVWTLSHLKETYKSGRLAWSLIPGLILGKSVVMVEVKRMSRSPGFPQKTHFILP